MSKKCSVPVLKKVLKVKADAKKTTTWEDAWNILATAYNLEGAMECKLTSSRFIIYKDEEAVHEIRWNKKMWNDKEGDFLWDPIYKEVLDYCISARLLTTKKKKPTTREIINEDE